MGEGEKRPREEGDRVGRREVSVAVVVVFITGDGSGLCGERIMMQRYCRKLDANNP